MEEYAQLRTKNLNADVRIKSVVSSFKFCVIGTVSKVYKKGFRVDVTLPYLDVNNEKIVLKGIEVLRTGTHKLIVRYVPDIGDTALVLSPQNCIPECKFGSNVESWNNQPYSVKYGEASMKAVLVQTNEDNEDAIFVEVTSNEAELSFPDSISNVKINAKKIDINNGHLTVT